ncbi:MAG: c-type cytochrome [Ignavibacteria bacterium]
MMRKTLMLILSIPLLVLSIEGCGKKDNQTLKQEQQVTTSRQNGNLNPIAQKGKDLFYAASKENGLKCADCHSDGTNTNSPLTKYFSNVIGANKRQSTYGGKFVGNEVAKNAGGATVCWKQYLLNDEPLTEEQVQSLNEYFTFLLKEGTPTESKYTTIALPKPDKEKFKKEDKPRILALQGNKIKGEQIFKEACAFCHSEESTVKKTPKLKKFDVDRVDPIAFHVRLGVKAMPFFVYEKFSDQDIADVSAYILAQLKK